MAVYGDTSGILRDHEQALHQDIALPGGNDTIVGGNGRANSLTGDAQQMTDHAEGGDDMLTSNSGGASALFGDAQAMSGSARGGNDTLIGSNLISFGDMYGDARALADNSVGGNDVLISGRGIDHMWGDAAVVAAAAVTGADTFVFAPGGGRDDINDFRQSDGDRIDVSAWGIEHFEDMAFTTNGTSTTISFDGSSSVTLVGIADPFTLHTSDFIFA